MIHINEVKTGIARYIDAEIMPQMNGWQRWVFGAASAAYLSKAAKVIEELSKNKAITILDIIDGQNIDVDAIYNYMRPHCNTPASVNIPGMGTITLTAADADKLYDYIRSGT